MIQTVLLTLLGVTVPLSIPVIAGMLLKKYQNLDTKPLLTLYLYFLTPALILDSLSKAKLSYGDVFQTLAFSVLNLLLLWAAAWGIGKGMKLSAPETAGLTLISTFTNSVNYGLPLVLLAFGQMGLDKASVYVIAQMLIVNTVGVYFAARSHFSVRQAIRSVFALPAIYAAVFAMLLRALDLQLPVGIAKGISMVAAAYAPVVLALLGAQMMSVSRHKLEGEERRTFGLGMAVRSLLSPVIALAGLTLLGIEGILFNVLFILASMPVAVNAVVLAERYDASPKIVSACILWSTLLSFVILPVYIVWVQ
ncbi:permease [Paenibacillus swuensis]|uniref:Permease n=1 Tax=Paenibacillus swuensis TaxID=1178515 RepID=A0A172TF75_9BACL|nr:AEC family transporter [Paenibacillus swuensis]ANE45698.1 permease [Paenibacillus swuensis]